ncbi:hypothetical protein ACFVZW_27040 [Streptomyces sp. NPDC059567]|uniref:hypothetical protein n=1 Tax=Streptomyces sp. NPDC059567 TaxID=3346867 RepID=UPI0036AF3DDF
MTLLPSMRWDDEVRDPGELAPDDVGLTEKEVCEALAVLETMSVEHLADVGEAEFTNQCREALVEVIEAKAEHHEPKAAEGAEATPPPPPYDGGDGAGGGPVPGRPAGHTGLTDPRRLRPPRGQATGGSARCREAPAGLRRAP